MATKSSKKTYADIVRREEPANTKPGCCKTCLHSQLLQYGNNPLLADCHKKPQQGNEMFPYERMVASCIFICPTYKEDPESEKKEVIQMMKAV